MPFTQAESDLCDNYHGMGDVPFLEKIIVETGDMTEARTEPYVFQLADHDPHFGYNVSTLTAKPADEKTTATLKEKNEALETFMITISNGKQNVTIPGDGIGSGLVFRGTDWAITNIEKEATPDIHTPAPWKYTPPCFPGEVKI